jgi:hypothetical protein
MLLSNFTIEEKTIKSEDKPKNVFIGAHVIVDRVDSHWSIPVMMNFTHKDNGSYLKNYKIDVEAFLEICERINENYIVDPERDTEFLLK